MDDFGEMVRQRRREAGMSQEELARRVPCSTGTIRNIERGRTAPSYRVLRGIQAALSLEPADMGRYRAWGPFRVA